MSIPKRLHGPGTYFVTSVTQERRRVFQVLAHAELLIATLQLYSSRGLYKLHAFVVMPDHFHLLLTPQEVTLERAMGMIKGGFSRALGAKATPWQRGFTDHRIRDREDFLVKRQYIHQNPVRARLAQVPEEYRYSSAFLPSAGQALSG